MAEEMSADTRDLRRLVQSMRGASNAKDLRKILRRQLTAAGKPMIPVIRSEIMGIPSQNQNNALGRPGLRKSTARAVRLQVATKGGRAGVVVRVDPKKMPTGQHNLPAYLEGTFTPWKSPNWKQPGHRVTWKVQHHHPYFAPVAQRFEPRVRAAVADAINEIERQIQR
jgi:hypothetical protein